LSHNLLAWKSYLTLKGSIFAENYIEEIKADLAGAVPDTDSEPKTVVRIKENQAGLPIPFPAFKLFGVCGSSLIMVPKLDICITIT
jgi:hypothetical protein